MFACDALRRRWSCALGPRLRQFGAKGLGLGLGLLLLGALLLLGVLASCWKPVKVEFSDFAAGIGYSNVWLARKPLSIHIVRVSRAEPEFGFHCTHAHGTALGLSPLTEQLKLLKPELGTPLVGVNGDFYQWDRAYAGDPRGLQIVEGELLSAPAGGVSFWVDSAGQPHATNVASLFKVTWPDGTTTPFGLNEHRKTNAVVLYTPAVGKSTHTTNGTELVLEPAGDGPWLPLRAGETRTTRVREVRATPNTRLHSNLLVLSLSPRLVPAPPTVETGAVLRLSLATRPDLRGIQTAIGGGPVLVHLGQRQKLRKPSLDGPLPYQYRSMWERHPRTALGWNEQHFFFVLVDGRQKGFSQGMKLDELAKFMIGLGCQEVINLDGGGSATLWCCGEVVNSPCDGYEREIANALFLVRKGPGQAGIATPPAAN